MVVVVVEPRFTHRHDLWMIEQRGNSVEALRGIVGMDARGCPHVVVGLGDTSRDQRMLEIGTDRDERGDARRSSLGDRAIIVDAQVAMVVDPRHAVLSPSAAGTAARPSPPPARPGSRPTVWPREAAGRAPNRPSRCGARWRR